MTISNDPLTSRFYSQTFRFSGRKRSCFRLHTLVHVIVIFMTAVSSWEVCKTKIAYERRVVCLSSGFCINMTNTRTEKVCSNVSQGK